MPRFIKRAWEWLNHLSLVSWLMELLKASLGPAVGVMTYLIGLGQNLPLSYLIAAACVSAGAVMWLVNQLTAFARRYIEGYAYGLAYEGVIFGLVPNNEQATAQLSVQLRNVSQRPMKYRVESFSVVIGDRTIADPAFHTDGGIIAHGVARTYAFPAFSKTQVDGFLDKHAEGTMSFAIVYGHPDADVVRRLIMKISLGLNFALEGKHGVKDIIKSESDESI